MNATSQLRALAPASIRETAGSRTEMALFAVVLMLAAVEVALACGLVGSRELAIAVGILIALPGCLILVIRSRTKGFTAGSRLLLLLGDGLIAFAAHALAFFPPELGLGVLFAIATGAGWVWARLITDDCGPADYGLVTFAGDCTASIAEGLGAGASSWVRLLAGDRTPARILAWERQHKHDDMSHLLPETEPGDGPADGPSAGLGSPPRRSTEKLAHTTQRSDQAMRDGTERDSDAEPTFTVDVHHFPPRPLDEILAELDSLIGLGEVKQQVRDLLALVEVGRQRRAMGLEDSSVTLHLRFEGAPGTGKTTVARLVAELLSAVGALPEPKMVEADRAALVGGYQGHTSSKVNAVVDAALGGVLFIDEAYALSQGPGDTFGAEALTTLLARAENDRDRIAIVLAGYSSEMTRLMDQNPGLRSRFHRVITFEDFDLDQLLEVARREAAIAHRDLTDDALMELRAGLETLLAGRDRHWGNGREVRSLIELAKLAQARRLKDAGDLTAEKLTDLDGGDVRSALAKRQGAVSPA